MVKIVPIKGDQIPLPIEVKPPKLRLWLQVFHRDRYYTYHEFKKQFTLESWDAKCYYTLGRARTARYALRNNRQLRDEFDGCEILIYDADLDKIVDPPEPEPKPAAAERLPNCPECGAVMLRPYTICPTCEWEEAPAAPALPLFGAECLAPIGDRVVHGEVVPTESNGTHGKVCLLPDDHTLSVAYDDDQRVQMPASKVCIPAVSGQESALKQSISQLMAQLDGIRRNGAIAPVGCWIEQYTVSKKLGNGAKENFKYYRVKADKSLFENKHGQSTKSLHLGTESSAAYQDWKERIRRRNAIKHLEQVLDRDERKLQKLRSKLT